MKTGSFNAYAEWFGISNDHQPPNHYDLLGVAIFESNSEKIEEAFQNRYALVRRYQVGEHHEVAVRVLQELAQAHDCLQDDTQRQEYDQALAKKNPELSPELELEIESVPVAKVAAPQPKYWVTIPDDGRRIGPLVKAQLDQAVAEGRIRADYLVQKEGWQAPRPAGDVFPGLPAVTEPSIAVPSVTVLESPVLPTLPRRRMSIPWFWIGGGVALLILIPISIFAFNFANDLVRSSLRSNSRPIVRRQRPTQPPPQIRTQVDEEERTASPQRVIRRVPEDMPQPPPARIVPRPVVRRPAESSYAVDFDQWGEYQDPSGTCSFQALADRMVVDVPGPSHGLSVELGHMEAPRYLKKVKGDFIVSVKVEGTFTPGSNTWNQRVPFNAAGIALMQSDQTYFRLERATFVRGQTANYVNWELREDGKIKRFGGTADVRIQPSMPTYLRLERRGDVLIASARQSSSAGWRMLPPLRVNGLDDELELGFAAVNNTTRDMTATFTELEFQQREED